MAPRLVLLVPEDDGPEGRRAHALLKAYAILGGAYRATSQHDAAEEQYQTALRLADSEVITPDARADFDQRLSYLRMCQGRLDDAEALLSGDLAVLGSIQLRAEILVKRGMIRRRRLRFSEAIECHGEALRITNPKASRAAERLHLCAAHNLAHAVSNVKSRSMERPEVWAALRYVRAAGQLIKGQRNSMARHLLQWVEGLCWREAGHYARAERAFGRARRGFLRLRLPWEIALVSLDLAALHRDCGEWPELETLAADTYQRFRALSGNTQALAALSLCVDAAQARRALSATAGQEMIEQAQRNAAAAIAGARDVVTSRMARS